jgi:3'(2'), 5'-bisphosphate nucleotidase
MILINQSLIRKIIALLLKQISPLIILIDSCLKSISSYPVISEESENFYTTAKKYWLVDPLDGTKEFINKNGEFTINIALIENRYPHLRICLFTY